MSSFIVFFTRYRCNYLMTKALITGYTFDYKQFSNTCVTLINIVLEKAIKNTNPPPTKLLAEMNLAIAAELY